MQRADWLQTCWVWPLELVVRIYGTFDPKAVELFYL